jgi:hypothetical protein
MQQHHIDPCDVRPPRYCDQQVSDQPPREVPHRLRQFIFPLTLVVAFFSVAHLTLAAI